MSEQVYLCTDAAADIAALINDCEAKLRHAQDQKIKHFYSGNKTKEYAAKRDLHRAETSILAYKESLRLVLLEQACRETGSAQPMPDINEYLDTKTQALI